MAGGFLTAQIVQSLPSPVTAREEMRAAVREGRAPNIVRAGALEQLRRLQGPAGNAQIDAAAAQQNAQLMRTMADDSHYAAPYSNATPWTANLYRSVGGAGGIAIGVGVLAAIGVGIYFLRK